MTRPVPQPTGDVHETAALWYARMSSDVKTAADEDALDAWLAVSPEHAEAYAEACALAGRFDALAGHPEVAALRVDAQLFEEKQRRPWAARFGAWTATGVAAAAAAAGFFYLSSAPLETQEWTTARGETREIVLSDSSEVVLGSDSKMAIRFRRDRREVELERGQAFFEVAENGSRPFVVFAEGRSVTALGTAFDVRAYDNETTVTLLRGSVAIDRIGERTREAVLAPGQQFQARYGVTAVRDVDAATETSWRSGILQFHAVTLAEAVSAFNRNASSSIILADPRLADRLVSGVFRANDAQGFSAALEPGYPIVATQQSSGDIVLSYRAREEAR